LRQQQQSKTIKKGSPPDHEAAVVRVLKFLYANRKSNRIGMMPDYPLIYDKEFCKQLPKDRFPGHRADIGIDRAVMDKESEKLKSLKLVAIIEINGKHGGYWKNGLLVSKYGPTKHDNPIQKEKDKIVQNWCERKKIKYIVLLKEEILGDCGKDGKDEVDTEPYLRENLKEFIK
jgi:hypothetical protein